MRSLRPALTRFAGVILAALATAAPAAADELVRLVSPSPDVALVGGSTVVLEWQPGPGLAALPHAEEWEAFLSLDGGRTFLSRITPHLDVDRRRVTVRVPPLPSGDVRLLIRVGDERDERGQLIPGRYRIVLAGAATPAPAWRSRRPSRGEAARPGAPGVVAWVEGERDGSGWREYEVERNGLALQPALAPGEAGWLLLAPLPDSRPKLSRTPLAASTSRALIPAAPDCAAPLATAATPRLASLCRRNL